MPRADPLDPTEVDELFAEFRRTGDRALRNRLVELHTDVAQQEARRFAHRGEPLDDLVQVARLGVLKAVERYDPDFGVPFTAYARPTVSGELRRHFRDATWAVHVPRGLKDLHSGLGKATSELTNRLGRQPTAAELAERMQCSVDELLEASELRSAYRPGSINAPRGEDGSEVEPPANDDVDEISLSVDRVALRDALAILAPRERTIVYLRFFGQLSQSEIAERVGTSQVHVSRLLRASLASMRSLMDAGTTDPARRMESAADE
jgi:RNA polymerase sigma-B factor